MPGSPPHGRQGPCPVLLRGLKPSYHSQDPRGPQRNSHPLSLDPAAQQASTKKGDFISALGRLSYSLNGPLRANLTWMGEALPPLLWWEEKENKCTILLIRIPCSPSKIISVYLYHLSLLFWPTPNKAYMEAVSLFGPLVTQFCFEPQQKFPTEKFQFNLLLCTTNNSFIHNIYSVNTQGNHVPRIMCVCTQ